MVEITFMIYNERSETDRSPYFGNFNIPCSIITLLLFLFVCSFASAQWIKKDTMLNNVVRIEEKNVAHIDDKYLVDIPLFLRNMTIYNNSSLPDNLLFTQPIYNCPVNFLLISPNKNKKGAKYYKVHIGGFSRGDNWIHQDIKVDSISLPNNKCPMLNFHSFETDTNRIAYFCSDYHGSVLYEDDTINKPKVPTIWNSIKDYENKHGVKITPKVFNSGPLGLEGESETYIVLKGLSPEQTLEFLLEKEKSTRKAYGLKEEIDTKSYPPKRLYIPDSFNKK